MGFLDNLIITVNDLVRTGFKKKYNDLLEEVIYNVSKPTANIIRFQKNNTFIDVPVNGTNTGQLGVIGEAEDGDYTDGLFTDFTASTPIGTPIDRFNELFKSLVPSPAPNLDNVTESTNYSTGKLSFGPTKNDISFVNVTTAAGNSAVDINGTYTVSTYRLGIMNAASISGVLNDDVVADTQVPNPSYPVNSFGNGQTGSLNLYMWNGATWTIRDTIDLTSSTAGISGTYMTVSASNYNSFPNGDDFITFSYRTGTFTITNAEFNNGFNAMYIEHDLGASQIVTNYLEWVYDNDSTNITASGGVMTPQNLAGSKFLSGVNYYTTGEALYQVTINNAYLNVYSSSASAIDFVNRVNLNNSTSIQISGVGIVNRIPFQNNKTLPNLDTAVSNPETTSIFVEAEMDISSSTLYPSDNITSAVSCLHPISSQQLATGGSASANNILLYNVSDTNTNSLHNFSGEGKRLEEQDYTALTYTNINSGTYNWDSSQDLITGANHSSGLLVFDSKLMYPNNSILNTTYGFTTSGDFTGLTYAPVSQPDYSSISDIRDYYGFFKSSNTTTQSTLTFEINHTGNASNFLTNGGTGGTPSGNNIKFEFLIVRTSNIKHGWSNPFASSGNPEGIAVLGTPTHSSGVTTVQCTLSTTPRVGNGDLVIIRVKSANGWSNYINSIEITNIS